VRVFQEPCASPGEAVAGGKVHVNGERVKPAHPIKTAIASRSLRLPLVRELLVVTLGSPGADLP